ncbi:MAG: MtnX-like HAD-IB family phosphatase [Bacillota bacterium]
MTAAEQARLDAFWRRALGAPLVVITDFDGTISQLDVGDLIWERLTPPSPETLRRLEAGEVGSRIAYLDSTVRVNPAEGEALADTVAIDPHFAAFAAWTEAAGVPLAVLSDGFTFYIDRILKREGLDHLPVLANEWVAPGQLAWPHGNPACDFCGCCKALVTRRLRQSGARIIYLGDGTSDLFAAAFADWVFARGRLARFMEENGSPYFPLDSFATPLALLQRERDRFRQGSMEGRVTLPPHPQCRFAASES